MNLGPVSVVRTGILLALFGVFGACSAGSSSGSSPRGGSSGGSTSISTGAQPTTGTAGSLSLGNLDPGTGGADAGHQTRCDSAGNCSCIAIASIGHEGVWGPCSSDNTTAFQNWLNTQSTAHVDNYEEKPTLTADFLAKYDVIILQWMVANGKQDNDGAPWVFSADEVAALKDWVNNGGGIVALSGYQCEDPSCIQDIVATNQLLSFTDIQFNRDVALSPKSLSNNMDLYCWGGSIPLGAPIASGIYSTGMWDQTTPIGAHVTDVGAYDARSITSTSATVDVSDAAGHYAVHEQIGKGHVVAYGDEWVTYSGEWTGTSQCLQASAFTNMYDPCYQKSPATIFQISQFWYNSLKYAASSVECFDITAPGIVK